ncbi:hypothetical protein O999_10835 [Pseudomonas putida LF54]|uniref:hypothetical protein n=1 Tax=Pseudomonas putida TaxID=303 RepID=UPI0003AECDC6|nr:hypothetical protein [Pseudomonas putida]ERK99711.1 hypothetical protein O999_10835 [Pseudomonas putida LF54]
MRRTTAALLAVLVTSPHAAQLSEITIPWSMNNPKLVTSTTEVTSKLQMAYSQYNCDKSDKQKDPEYCARAKAVESILGEGGIKKYLDAQEDFNAVMTGALESSVRLENVVEPARTKYPKKYSDMSAFNILLELSPLLDYALNPKLTTPPPPY